MDQPTDTGLIDHVSALKHPRQAAKGLDPLPDIILLLLCATLAGADDFVEIQLSRSRPSRA